MRHYLQQSRALLAQVQRVKARWGKVQEESTLEIEGGLSNDLVTITAEAHVGVQNLPEDSFKKIFCQ